MGRSVADDFDARRIAAKSPVDREGQLVDEFVEGGSGLEGFAVGGDQGGDDLFANVAVGRRDRDGTARPPEDHFLHEPMTWQALSTLA